MSRRDYSGPRIGHELQVTPTGRAKTPGRVTRQSLTGSGRKHSGAPLPIDLACHPKALSPTTRNPGCVTAIAPWGAAYLRHKQGAVARGANYFLTRIWRTEREGVPHSKFCAALYVQGRVAYCTYDINEAMGWKMAAKDYGISVELFYNPKGD